MRQISKHNQTVDSFPLINYYVTRALLSLFFSSHKFSFIKFPFLFYLVPLSRRTLMLVFSEGGDFSSVKYQYMTTNVMIFISLRGELLTCVPRQWSWMIRQALQKRLSSFISLVHLHLTSMATASSYMVQSYLFKRFPLVESEHFPGAWIYYHLSPSLPPTYHHCRPPPCVPPIGLGESRRV